LNGIDPYTLDPARRARVDAWLDEALDLDAEGRSRLLARVGATDPACGALLARLIGALGRPSSLDRPVLERAEPAATSTPATLDQGTMLGPWRIEALAGRGGMASVYRATRADGSYEQVVALKLLDSPDPELARRFANERALLAALDHPHIARLLDGGSTVDGRLWFAMAWIEGRDLDAHLAEIQPTLPARLDLFEQIAAAVAHAHRQLVVHRDLKPRNVRVTPEGRAVLLDFGIAKLSANGAPEARTRALMTPEYAAPEQLADRAIGTWTDVHGLGLLLHEMLSGRHPFPAAQTSLAAAVQAIISEPASSPSDAARGSGVPYAPGLLRGDLDAIVARCLEKDPARRYPSVEALLDDLDCHRRMLPVAARRGARRYRAGRWLRRNWLPASLGSAVLVSMGVGLVAFAIQADRVASERDSARLEVRRQEALREHLMLVFREGAVQGGDATAKELLDASAAQLDDVYGNAPELRRSVLLAMGELYFTLGDFPAARAMIERFLAAAGPDTPLADRVLGYAQQAQVLLRLGEREGARAAIDAATLLRSESGGPLRDIDSQLLAARSLLARADGDLEGGLSLQRQAVAATTGAVDGSAHQRGIAEGNLGMALLQANRLMESRRHFESAIEVFADAGYGRSVHAITTLGNLANVESLLGHYDEAGTHYREAERLASAATAESATMAALLQNHGRLLLILNRLDEALPRAERALRLAERYVGADSLDAAGIRLTLGEIALASGDTAAAGATVDAARAIYSAELPAPHPLIARADLVAAKIALDADANAALDPLLDAVQRLESAPPLLARQSVRGAVWIAETALERGDRALATRTLTRVITLPVFMDLPEADQAEARLWLRASGSAPADYVPVAADRARLQAALGNEHPRLRRLDLALGGSPEGPRHEPSVNPPAAP
jgi:non-specific serine/threonine protein kinase/serine/threonine-protein kinase